MGAKFLDKDTYSFLKDNLGTRVLMFSNSLVDIVLAVRISSRLKLDCLVGSFSPSFIYIIFRIFRNGLCLSLLDKRGGLVQ